MTQSLGLTTAQAESKLKIVGRNVLETKTANPWYKMLWSQFTDLLVIILLVAAIISFFHDKTESIIILSIVALNAAIGFFQEFRTEKTLEALKNMVHPQIRVMRDGKEMMIQTEYLVPGDVVILAEGDKVPADGILIESHSLKLDEAILTGESVPVEKKIKDKVFMGTAVAKGSAMFEVTFTGMTSEFGKIAELTTSTKNAKSPLEIELERIGMFVTKMTGVICLILFALGFLRDVDFSDTTTYFDAIADGLIFSVSVAIAAVPEGLPTTITVALALGASVLARKHAIVKRLSSVETLGAVSTICSDKTGTLTKNEMTVRALYLGNGESVEVTGVGYDPREGDVRASNYELKSTQVLLNLLSDICWYCNEAKLVHKKGHYTILGDPTEGALLTFVEKYAKKLQVRGSSLETLEVFPFDSDRKMMSVIVSRRSTKGEKLLVKGSPDQLLAKCEFYFDGVKVQKFTQAKKNEFIKEYQSMASKALRVLALAYREVDLKKMKNETQAEKELVFAGLLGMIDPPRDEVREAVTKCHAAGIRVIVITGDYGITAKAIAGELGIVKADGPVLVLTGDEVKKMSDKELSKILKDKTQQVIFARSLPDQKMRVVKLLQDHREIVAMTGDGVNDAPALKKANIGVAMGITGTEVSKEAASMILLNDSFASIVTAVEEGRRIYENLKKFVWFIFSCNIGELFVIFTSIVFAFPLALTAILILCIDLGTDILPAIALGVDPAEPGLMEKPPRNPKKRVMDRAFVTNFMIMGCVIGACVVGIFLYALIQEGWKWGSDTSGDFTYPRTMAFTALVMVQLVNAFSAKSFRRSLFSMNLLANKFLLLAIGVSLLLVYCMLYVPFFNDVLKTYPLNLSDWGWVAVASIIPLVVLEGMKWRTRSKEV
ncbi:MAG TPA: cation-transporting P-type ATPase [Candidatus Gracilibacteria bacterium]